LKIIVAKIILNLLRNWRFCLCHKLYYFFYMQIGMIENIKIKVLKQINALNRRKKKCKSSCRKKFYIIDKSSLVCLLAFLYLFYLLSKWHLYLQSLVVLALKFIIGLFHRLILLCNNVHHNCLNGNECSHKKHERVLLNAVINISKFNK
jgi:hypothetical protein